MRSYFVIWQVQSSSAASGIQFVGTKAEGDATASKLYVRRPPKADFLRNINQIFAIVDPPAVATAFNLLVGDISSEQPSKD